jgi:formylmethanofuran dehydrogenase subunit A
VAPQYDPAIEPDIRAYFEKYSSIQFGNYPVGDEYLDRSEVVACE